MKNRIRKALSTLCIIALLASSIPMVFAEEAVDAPVETAPVETVEVPVDVPAEEPAAEELPIIIEETPAEPAPAEETPAEEPAPVEETPVVEETPAEPAPVEEVPAEPAPVEEAPVEPAPVEEAPVETKPEETPVEETSNNKEETKPEESEDEIDELDGYVYEESSENDYVEMDDGPGYIDGEVAKQLIPDSNELKFDDIAELKIGSEVKGNLAAGEDAEYVLKSGRTQDVVLGLTGSNIRVKIDGQVVKFIPVEGQDDYAEYAMTVHADVNYSITLSADSGSYKLSAEKATEAADTESDTPASDEDVQEETQDAVETESDETAQSEETENTEAIENTEETENTEDNTEEENIDGNNEEETEVENEDLNAEPIKAWVTVSEEEFEVGNTITLNANADIELDNAIVWQTRGEDGEWHKIGYGMKLEIELTEENINNSFRFKLADETFSDEYQLFIRETENDEGKIEEDVEESTDEEFSLPEDRSVSFQIFWDGKAAIGEIAHFKANLVGYEGLDYTIQWQSSTDNNNWSDIAGETNESMDLLATEEANKLYYRVIVIIQTPDNYEPQE